MTHRIRALLAFFFVLSGLVACEGEPSAEANADAGDGLVLQVGEEDPEAGKAMFSPASMDAKEDSVSGRKGLPVSVDQGAAAVWEVRNQWADTQTAEAKKAGIAWPANSGLTWDEKFSAWVAGFPLTQGAYGRSTFSMTTPYGKTLPAPSLECAEVALFLRATFASWYGLPFFVEALDGRTRIFLGHFGFLREDGTRYGSTPNFKTAYADHSSKAQSWQTDGWPKDNTLRSRKLGGSQDDFQPALGLGDDVRAGTYFDELYLNKRTGYFMVLLLSYFGSINVADPTNTFNLDPRALRAGDPLVERWQKTGIGHVYVTKNVEPLSDGGLSAELMSGSMPRRQPVWESAAASQSAYTSDTAGGPGTGWDGAVYAKIGGGLKRWRTPINDGGRWNNIVPVADRASFIDASNTAAIAGRIETFREILGSLTPEEQLQTIMEEIEAARDHLRRLPASCAARTRRENAFRKLYPLMQTYYGLSGSEVDAAYRQLEDYALAELVYNESRTCCWNSTTQDMFEIILDLATEETSGELCAQPTVFKVTEGGYAAFEAHAARLGRAAQWKTWRADETCPQSATANDVIAESDAALYCEVRDLMDGPTFGEDPYEPNNLLETAAVIELNTPVQASISVGDLDYFKVVMPEDGRMTVSLSFNHAQGDLDLALLDGRGQRVAQSRGVGNVEQLNHEGASGQTYYVEVSLYGQNIDGQRYELLVEFDVL